MTITHKSIQSVTFYLLIVLLIVVNSCSSDEVKPTQDPILDHYIETVEGPADDILSQYKTNYKYNSAGKLHGFSIFLYDPGRQSYSEERHFNFTYLADSLRKIEGFLAADADHAYVEYSFSYFSDGRVSEIHEINRSAGVNSVANFYYDEVNKSGKVLYAYSNGRSFQYEFTMQDGNIVADRETQGSQLCNEGQYIYDQHPNPFQRLGFVDNFLTNFSTNNKLVQNVEYTACVFPTVRPEYYTYEYDNREYPIAATGFYKSGNSFGKIKRQIFYR